MQAVINATDEGARLRPLTCARCSAMLPILSYPAIGRLIDTLRKHDVTNIIVITGYMGRETVKWCEGEIGVDIKLVSSDYGDSVALKNHSDLLEEEFIYFSSVLYSDGDLKSAVERHRERNAYATIITAKNISGGKITADKNGRVTRFEEKRMWSIFPISTGSGIYILNRDIVRFIPEESTLDFAHSVLPSLVRAGKEIYQDPLCTRVEDLSDFASYMRANFSCLEQRKKGAYVEEGAEVESGALLEYPCFIAKGAHIAKGAKIGAYSVIGKNCRIAKGASVKRSVIGDGCIIAQNSALRGCVIDDNTAIGRNSAIYEQAVIGRGCQIGRDCAVRSFVRIWPEKTVDDAMTVSENIMWGQKKRSSLYENGEISGVANSDITSGFCLKVGECVATAADGGDIGVSSDGSPASSMLRDALIAGVLGTGASVKDFGEQPLPITRRGVAYYMLSAGIGISAGEVEGEEQIKITVMERGGSDAGEEMRRKMEAIFENGDVSRCDSRHINEREYLFEYKLYYLKNLIKSTSGEKLDANILISCPAAWGRRLLMGAAADLGCKISMYTAENAWDNTEDFAVAVHSGGFDIGFAIEQSCEKLKIVTSKAVIENEIYEAFYTLLVMKKHKGCEIFVPVTASSAIETMAQKYNATVTRTKTADYEIMEKIIGNEDYLEEQFIFRFDAVGAVIKILDCLAESKTDIEELLSLLPSISMARSEVEIKSDRLIDIMSKVTSFDNASEAAEGVKITFDKGWVMVVPNTFKKVCSVVSEGVNTETARELCDFTVNELTK